jgi:SAM-dependent methyltransferase
MTNSNILTQRTHDQLYLTENRYDHPKEIFKFIASEAFFDQNSKDLKICDFGCAAGEFLYYLQKIHPNNKFFGVDIVPDLVIKSKDFNPKADLKVGSVLDEKVWNENSFDVSFLIGVYSIFDEIESCLSNLITWTKPGGKVFIYGMFNPFPLDVIIKYKHSQQTLDNVYENGWNIFSQETTSKLLDKNPKVKSFRFLEFQMGVDVKPQDDPVRSWTMLDKDSKRIITNGLCLIQPHFLLEVEV